MSVKNRQSVIVTGGTSGIGQATVHQLESEGFLVWNLDIEPDGRDFTIVTDVSSPGQVEKSIAQIVEKDFEVCGVFSNAGIIKVGDIETTSTEDINFLFKVNYLGVVNMMQATFPLLRHTKGSFVVCTSDQTFTPKPMTAIYGSLKAAISQLIKSAAITQGPFGLRVNGVAPGPIRTAMHNDVLQILSNSEGRSRVEIESEWIDDVPLGRIGTPTEVAQLVAFLLSERSSFINGAIIPIDGGLSAGLASSKSLQ